jgi:large subunit ribosomal protein L21e
MGRRKGTYRRKSRGKLAKTVRKKGKLSLSTYFQEFKPGDRVQLLCESSVHKGTYCLRFYGRIGVVMAKNGTCYNIKISDHNKEKTLIVHPVHLKRIV